MKTLETYVGDLSGKEFPLFTAFFDESGHSSFSRVVAIGGAYGSPKYWRLFREAWSVTLEQHGVKSFRMSDFENRFGEFRGWKEQQRRDLLAALFGILDETMLIPIGAAVVVEDFRKMTLKARSGFFDPWYICFQTCIQEVANLYLLVDDPEIVDPNIRAVVFEEQLEFWRAPGFFQQVIESARNGERLGMLAFARKQASIHLQVADLIAYEMRKHVENCLFDPARPTRWPMLQLQKRPMILDCFDSQGRPIKIDSPSMFIVRTGNLAQAEQGGKITLGANSAETPDIKDL
jgi:hypothetical protein